MEGNSNGRRIMNENINTFYYLYKQFFFMNDEFNEWNFYEYRDKFIMDKDYGPLQLLKI